MSHRGCPIKEAARKKRWYEKNKERQQLLGRNRESNKRKRRRSLLSFPCICCKESDPTVIQWHHVDNSTKDFDLFGGKGNSSAEDTWWNEVLKCIPVCANCHVKIHKKMLCLLPMNL